jgi:hypothetical protein
LLYVRREPVLDAGEPVDGGCAAEYGRELPTRYGSLPRGRAAVADLVARAAVVVAVPAVAAPAGAATLGVAPGATGTGSRDDIFVAVARARPGAVVAFADGGYALPRTPDHAELLSQRLRPRLVVVHLA